MGVLDPNDLNFNGKEIQELSEGIFEMVFEKPEFKLFHTITSGIKAKQQIALLGVLEGLTGNQDGGCDPTATAVSIGNSQKEWDPEYIFTRITECWKDLEGIFFIWGTQNGLKKQDLGKTEFWMFLMDRRADSLMEEVYRIVWFSDVDAADVNASPPGVLTAGTDPTFFNRINGFWKQLFAIVAADSDRVTAGVDARNNQATVALQAFDSNDTDNLVVSKMLTDMEAEADFRLVGMQGLQFIVTRSIFNQYKKELKFANIAFTTERLEGGILKLEADGIEVIQFQFWDRMIKKYYSDGVKLFRPHRALLTIKENTQIGTEEEGNLSEMGSIYDPIKLENHLDTGYNIDAKIIEDYKVQLGY